MGVEIDAVHGPSKTRGASIQATPARNGRTPPPSGWIGGQKREAILERDHYVTASALRRLAVELLAHFQIQLTVQRQQPADDRQQQIGTLKHAQDQERL